VDRLGRLTVVAKCVARTGARRLVKVVLTRTVTDADVTLGYIQPELCRRVNDDTNRRSGTDPAVGDALGSDATAALPV
jgi:hypothetical protein